MGFLSNFFRGLTNGVEVQTTVDFTKKLFRLIELRTTPVWFFFNWLV